MADSTLAEAYRQLNSQMVENMSGLIRHGPEKGRNNEQILAKFLGSYLPKRFAVTTGQVISVSGETSGQIDVIIRDQISTPSLIIAEAFEIVPIESVMGIISVKTTVDKPAIRDAMQNIESVRRLRQEAAVTRYEGRTVAEPTQLAPRALIFGFQSSWKDAQAADIAFRDCLTEFEDHVRPNGMALIDQICLQRKRYTTETFVWTEQPLFHFFYLLLRLLQTFPVRDVHLPAYMGDVEV